MHRNGMYSFYCKYMFFFCIDTDDTKSFTFFSLQIVHNFKQKCIGRIWFRFLILVYRSVFCSLQCVNSLSRLQKWSKVSLMRIFAQPSENVISLFCDCAIFVVSKQKSEWSFYSKWCTFCVEFETDFVRTLPLFKASIISLIAALWPVSNLNVSRFLTYKTEERS